MKDKSPLFILFVTIFVDLLGFGIVLPLIPNYAKLFTSHESIITMLTASFSLMQFIFAPLWGRISDKVGRRPVILVSLIGTTVGYLLFGLAGSLWMLFAARMWSGITTAGGISAAYAYIADVTDWKNRAKGMGLLGAAFGMGMVFGPLMGSELSTYSLALPFYVASAICGINFLLALYWLPESLTNERRAKLPPRQGFSFRALSVAMARPGIGPVLLVSFIVILAFSFLESTFALFLGKRFALSVERSSQLTGPFLGLVGVAIAVTQGALVGPISRSLGEKKMVWAGTIGTAVTLAFLPAMPNTESLAILMVLMAMCQGLSNPALSSLLTKESDPAEHGGLLGLNQGLSSMARFFGSGSSGEAMEKLGVAWPYYIGGAIMLIAFGASWRIRDPLAVRREHPDWTGENENGAPDESAPPTSASAAGPQPTSP